MKLGTKSREPILTAKDKRIAASANHLADKNQTQKDAALLKKVNKKLADVAKRNAAGHPTLEADLAKLRKKLPRKPGFYFQDFPNAGGKGRNFRYIELEPNPRQRLVLVTHEGAEIIVAIDPDGVKLMKIRGANNALGDALQISLLGACNSLGVK